MKLGGGGESYMIYLKAYQPGSNIATILATRPNLQMVALSEYWISKLVQSSLRKDRNLGLFYLCGVSRAPHHGVQF